MYMYIVHTCMIIILKGNSTTLIESCSSDFETDSFCYNGSKREERLGNPSAWSKYVQSQKLDATN